MKIGKNNIVAIMITFCFTATLFMVIPIKSATSPYDPWIDYNDDGKISLQDLVSLANSYGTTGDPTKNVNVTNWPSSMGNLNVTFPSDMNVNLTNWPNGYSLGNITVVQPPTFTESLGSGSGIPSGNYWLSNNVTLDGYRTYYLYLQWGPEYTYGNPVGINALFTASGLEIAGESWNPVNGVTSVVYGPLQVKGPTMRVQFYYPGPYPYSVSCSIYVLP